LTISTTNSTAHNPLRTKSVARDFHDAPRPVRVRFAPTVPAADGEFLHVGHAAMLIAADMVAREYSCPLDFRFDGTPQAGHVLDAANLCAWLGVLPRRFYTLIPAGENEIHSFARGDKSLAAQLDDWHISAGFDDLYLENNTVIVRGVEFLYEPTRAKITLQEQLWGAVPREELLYPILLRNGQKMSKSLFNTIHWSVLRDFDAARVREYFWRKACGGENYELDWKELL
jgi:glutamyl/glutaminyl-tRNA synthetase